MTLLPAPLVDALADRYRLERELGAGGMATVYLARDLRHDRDVAIKVLHQDLGAALGAERFVSEIRTTAKLQHAHILPLLDSGSAVDPSHGPPWLYYVMPLVTGETLRTRLARERQLPVADAVRVAREVASALDYAHRQGVVHRDIKPENILLHEGQAIVADFGIALAVEQAGGARMTQTGLSLGTPQYMSPEQATGERTIDARSDVYALGAVTYEMLTGEPPFTGASVQAIIAKILTERPVPIATTRDTVPAHVERAVLTALAKLPADRHASAKEFSEAIGASGNTLSASATLPASPRASGARSSRVWQVTAGALAVVALAATGFAMHAKTAATASADRSVIRAGFDLPAGARIADALTGTTIAVSPDGSMIAFTSVTAAGYRMYLRRVNELAAREVTDGSLAGRNLTFSPDGKWLAFTEGSVVRKVPVSGGPPVMLANLSGSVPYGIAWSATDTLYIGSFTGMYSVSADGGTPALTRRADPGRTRFGERWPLLLNNGQRALFVRGNNASANAMLGVHDLATGVVSEVSLLAQYLVGIVDGWLVYVSSTGDLKAVRINTDTGEPSGEPVVLENEVLIDYTSGAKVSVSSTGTLVYMRGRSEVQPILVTPSTGQSEALVAEQRPYWNPRYSPDGQRVALTVQGATSTDVWIYDVELQTFARLTTEGVNERPEWTPDGKSVVFVSERDGKIGIWQQPADASAAATLLYQPDHEPFEALVSPDGKWLVYRTAPGLEQSRDIMAVPMTGERKVIPLVTGPASETMPRLSPDGRWLAYQSNEAERFQIYVRPFPGNAGRVTVSTNGGGEPIWGRDGKSLYYRGPTNETIKVAVTTGATFTMGARATVLPSADYVNETTHASWDIAPDGRLLMLKRNGEAARMVVVHHWIDELRAKTSGK